MVGKCCLLYQLPDHSLWLSVPSCFLFVKLDHFLSISTDLMHEVSSLCGNHMHRISICYSFVIFPYRVAGVHVPDHSKVYCKSMSFLKQCTSRLLFAVPHDALGLRT